MKSTAIESIKTQLNWNVLGFMQSKVFNYVYVKYIGAQIALGIKLFANLLVVYEVDSNPCSDELYLLKLEKDFA